MREYNSLFFIKSFTSFYLSNQIIYFLTLKIVQMIVQNPNGSSYLFIDNRVFVSAYNETTNTVITVELNLSLSNNLTDWEKEQIKLNFGDILPDGYIYKVVVHSFGNHRCIPFDNLKSATDYANRFNEDNGFAYLYTNNPNVDTILESGSVYYLEDFDKLVYPFDLYDCKELSKSRMELMFGH